MSNRTAALLASKAPAEGGPRPGKIVVGSSRPAPVTKATLKEMGSAARSAKSTRRDYPHVKLEP